MPPQGLDVQLRPRDDATHVPLSPQALVQRVMSEPEALATCCPSTSRCRRLAESMKRPTCCCCGGHQCGCRSYLQARLHEVWYGYLLLTQTKANCQGLLRGARGSGHGRCDGGWPCARGALNDPLSMVQSMIPHRGSSESYPLVSVSTNMPLLSHKIV